METVSILQGGHERGIAALNFSGNGNVSTICLSVTIIIITVCN